MATELYVSADYNSSTEGWGTTHFSNYSSALNYAKTNAKKAVIVMEKTTTISGNCIDHSTHKNLTGLDVVIQDGAVMGNANSKWDMTYDVTIQGGGVMQSARGSSSSYGNTHIKNSAVLTIGEADSEKKAVLNFVNGVNGISYKTMCIAVLYNGYLVANNAEINVGDLGLIGNAEIADCTMLVAGSLGFGAHKSQNSAVSSLTNSTVTVKGHNLNGEGTYYIVDANRIANIVMDNSHIIIDDGKDDTVADVVELGFRNGMYKKPLTLKNNSSITIEKGTDAKALWDVTVSDSVIDAGNLSIENGVFAMTGKSAVNVATLTIAEGLTLTMDSSSVLTLDALAGAGMIEINMVEGFAGVKNIINFANDDATEAMLEILSRVKSRDERIYTLLMTAFQTDENLSMRASYLAAYGDERALPILLARIEDETLGFVDFQELKYAIEALGGEYNEPRDFSGDKDYIAVEANASSKFVC